MTVLRVFEGNAGMFSHMISSNFSYSVQMYFQVVILIPIKHTHRSKGLQKKVTKSSRGDDFKNSLLKTAQNMSNIAKTLRSRIRQHLSKKCRI